MSNRRSLPDLIQLICTGFRRVFSLTLFASEYKHALRIHAKSLTLAQRVIIILRRGAGFDGRQRSSCVQPIERSTISKVCFGENNYQAAGLGCMTGIFERCVRRLRASAGRVK
jgi:hypothetical protein